MIPPAYSSLPEFLQGYSTAVATMYYNTICLNDIIEICYPGRSVDHSIVYAKSNKGMKMHSFGELLEYNII